MKIGLVLSRPPAFSETFFRTKIRGLQENGFEVSLFVEHGDSSFTDCPQFCLPQPRSVNAMILFFHTLLFQPLRTIRFFRMDRQLQRSWFTVVKNFMTCLHLLNAKDLQWIHFGFATMAVGRESASRALGSRMGISLRGFDISRFPLRNPGVFQHVWQRVDRVHAISKALLQKAHADGLKTLTSAHIIHPAIDTNVFYHEPHSEVIPDRIQILTVARLHWSKGLEYTLAALSLLKKKGIDFHYTIVGDGKDQERYIFAAYQYGLEGQVTLVGKAEHNKLVQYYNRSHIYLQYSVQEGFSNATLEAQAMGLPCIVSDAEGLPENVVDGKTGWVVPRRQPVLLAAKLQEVISMSPLQRFEICKNATTRVKAQFDLVTQKKSFVAFFK